MSDKIKWMFLLFLVIGIVFVIADATNPPTHDNPILNSSSIKNMTIHNLTVFNQSTEDLDGDDVKNIVDWYKEGNGVMVLNMPFEGGSNATFTKDYSGWGNNGTVNNATWSRTSGHDGFGSYTYVYDDAINISDDDSLSFTDDVNDKPFSFSFWVYTDNFTSFSMLTKGYNGGTYEYLVTTNQNDVFFFYLWDASTGGFITPSNSINLTLYEGQWVHIAGTYNGSLNNSGTMALYFNGEKMDSGELIQLGDYYGMENQEGDLQIGLHADGKIDDLVIWNRSLSQQQVISLYENRTNELVSQETNINDVWSANMTPNDGFIDGATKGTGEVTILDNNLPTHNAPLLNSTTGNNFTSDNLSVFNQSTADLDGEDSVKNIINWYKNGTSFIVLNMPFEGNVFNGSQATDYSGYGNNGTNSLASWDSDGGYDGFGAYEFDGRSKIIIEDANSLDLIEEFSVELRFKRDNTCSAYPRLISKEIYDVSYVDDSFLVGLDDVCDDLSFQVVNDSGSTSTASTTGNEILAGEWYHVVGVYHKDNGMTLYLDGVSVDTSSAIGEVQVSTVNITIGSQANEIHNFFNGFIDEVRIYNESLSVEQVQALYLNQTNVIVSQETAIGEIWNASITPNDGYVDGSWLWAYGLQTLSDNVVPEVSLVNITSSSFYNYTVGDVTGAWNFSDEDGDSESEYETKWWKNAVEQTNLVNLTLIDSGNVTKGDWWNFSVRVFDGNDWSGWSDNFSLTIVNAMPNVSLNISSVGGNNYSTQDIFVNYSFVDLDLDGVDENETRWYLDGVLNESFNNYTVVNNGNLTAGDEWMVSVRGFDGDGWGDWMNGSLTVVAVPVEDDGGDGGGGGGAGGGGGGGGGWRREEVEEDEDEEEKIIQIVEEEDYNLEIREEINCMFSFPVLVELEDLEKDVKKRIDVYDSCIGLLYVEFTSKVDISYTSAKFYYRDPSDAKQFSGFNMEMRNVFDSDIDSMDFVYAINKEWVENNFAESCSLENFGLEAQSGNKYYGDYLEEDEEYYYFVSEDVREIGLFYISSFNCDPIGDENRVTGFSFMNLGVLDGSWGTFLVFLNLMAVVMFVVYAGIRRKRKKMEKMKNFKFDK